MPDERLVKKGRSEPLDALLQQGRASHELAKAHPTVLSDNGWLADDTTAMGDTITSLDTKSSAKADAHEVALGLTSAQERAIDATKQFMRKLRNGLPRALRDAPSELEVTASSFKVGEPLERSVPKISTYLGKIRPSVVRIDPYLTRFFAGETASTILDTVKTNLDTADAVQEAALAALPNETQEVYELKGRLLEMIEDLNRAGRSAFDGDATKRAMFNKDILLRGRAAKRKKEADDDKKDAEDDSNT